ncbi:MAG: DUF4249 family protein [Bacteroidota bacterium]
MLRYLTALALISLTFSACRDDFSLGAPPKDIPIIYAYLDANASENFVRVERAFLDNDGDANDVARIADSLYYGPEQATVSITSNGNTVILERVNGDDLGLEREPGLFAESPNILYRLSSDDLNLVEGQEAIVTVSTDQGTEATGSTMMLQPLEIRTPDDDDSINPENFNQLTTLRIDVNGEEARVFDIRLFHNLREFATDGSGEVTSVRLEQIVETQALRPTDNNILVFRIDNESIWRFLGNSLDPDLPVTRLFDGFDVEVTAAGQEVEDLIDLSNANSGITSSQAPPVFTNVEGGLGVVTSRSSAIRFDVPLSQSSFTELRDGIYTGNLNFQN